MPKALNWRIKTRITQDEQSLQSNKQTYRSMLQYGIIL